MELLRCGVNTTLVLGVAVPFYPQIRAMQRAQDTLNFNTKTSLIIVAANTTRCFFYLAKPFDSVLLVQSLVAVATQAYIMHIIVQLTRSQRASTSIAASLKSENTFFEFDYRQFWRWTDFSSYVYAWGLYVVFLALLHGRLGQSPLYAELLGALALGTEAMLPLPQALQNYRMKSSAGLGWPLIASWLMGDAFKTLIAVQIGAPLQFVVCGIFQLCIDTVLLSQMAVLYPARRSYEAADARSHDALDGGAALAQGSSLLPTN